MRVIAGLAKGRQLAVPQNTHTRPTLERHKDSLFNILSPYIEDAVFLDLFCGCGAIGIEALSRGAAHCHFVDNHEEAIHCTRANIGHTQMDQGAFVYCLDAHDALSQFQAQGLKFDILFIDPPYKWTQLDELLGQIANSSLLKKRGIVIIQHATSTTMPEVSPLFVYRVKKYGKTSMSFMSIDE